MVINNHHHTAREQPTHITLSCSRASSRVYRCARLVHRRPSPPSSSRASTPPLHEKIKNRDPRAAPSPLASCRLGPLTRSPSARDFQTRVPSFPFRKRDSKRHERASPALESPRRRRSRTCRAKIENPRLVARGAEAPRAPPDSFASARVASRSSRSILLARLARYDGFAALTRAPRSLVPRRRSNSSVASPRGRRRSNPRRSPCVPLRAPSLPRVARAPARVAPCPDPAPVVRRASAPAARRDSANRTSYSSPSTSRAASNAAAEPPRDELLLQPSVHLVHLVYLSLTLPGAPT